MRNKALKNIRDGLETYLGKDTQFEDTRVEEVTNQFPGTVTVNRFIGIDIQEVRAKDREIGAFGSLIKDYTCQIVVLVKGADYDKMKDELDIIVHRTLRYLALDTGGLNGLQDTVDSDIERIITYKVNGILYGNGKMKSGSLGHLCTITVIITTETHFV